MADARPAPSGIPPEVRPGDLYTINGRDWFMHGDVQWFWSGQAWERSGSAEPVPPEVAADMAKLAQLRLRVLRTHGYLP